MIFVSLTDGQTRNDLQAIGRMLGRPRLALQGAARSVRKRLQSHFRDRDRQGNKLGGKRTHFWLDVYKSTQIGEVTDTFAVVVIGDARFVQKVYGGTIRAKNAKNLSIPVDPLAYGRRPAVFERETGLQLIFIRQNDHALLATRAEGSEALQVRYLLTPQVTQAADPAALPPFPELAQTAVEGAEAQLRLAIQRYQKP